MHGCAWLFLKRILVSYMMTSVLCLIEHHELSVPIPEPTCFKSINPTCIDNFLASKKTRFLNTLTFETGASDHHKLIGTMLRSTFAKGKPKKIFYGCYKNFDNEKSV